MASSSHIHRRATSPLGSVLSFDELDLDVESVIGDGGIPTSVLVAEARTIANSTLDVVLRSHENRTVYTGKLLHALLDYASKNIIPDRGSITGERYTAGVIYAAYKRQKVREAADAWLQSMLLPSAYYLTDRFFKCLPLWQVKAAGNVRTVEPSEEQTPVHELESMRATVESATRNAQRRLRKEVRLL